MENAHPRAPARRHFAVDEAMGVKLGSIAGMDIRLDWSLAIIFALISVTLATGLFQVWHPGWSSAARWAVAISAAVLFLGSILAHELAHAVVGLWRGARIRSITLFVLGGLARFEGEFIKPMDEFLSAIAGPFMSVVIGLAATWLGIALVPDDLITAVRNGAPALTLYSGLSPLATLLLWLGPVNLSLALFNMIPGFPLDGGRVLRSIIWAATGSRSTATRWAAGLGRGFGWALMALGVLMAFGLGVPFFGAGPISGLWLILIGWFLATAARSSQEHLLIHTALRDVRVAELMQQPSLRVPAGLSLTELVRDYVLPHPQPAFLVQDGDQQVVGLVGFNEIGEVPRERWPTLTARDVMVPINAVDHLSPDEPVSLAFETLLRDHTEQLPVVQDGRVKGVLRMADVMRWVTLNPAHGH